MEAKTCSSTNHSFLFFLVLTLCVCLRTIEAQDKVANIEFYMHDIVDGSNPTAIRVAPANNSNGLFGLITVIDNALTATEDPKSTLIGRAQGIYVMSQQQGVSLLMTLTYMMVSGPYSGSTFSVLGRNPVMEDVREMPIVGGTGMFRLARGYCLAHTVSASGANAVVRYNVTVLHSATEQGTVPGVSSTFPGGSSSAGKVENHVWSILLLNVLLYFLVQLSYN